MGKCWHREKRVTCGLSVWASLVAQMVKNLLQCGRLGFSPWVGKIPRRRKWQPSPILLPGESHGQRSLMGYSPWGLKELDTTEQLTLNFTSNFCGLATQSGVPC